MIKFNPNPKYATYIQCNRCGRKVYTEQKDELEIRKRFGKGGWTFLGRSCWCRDCSQAIEEDED